MGSQDSGGNKTETLRLVNASEGTPTLNHVVEVDDQKGKTLSFFLSFLFIYFNVLFTFETERDRA